MPIVFLCPTGTYASLVAANLYLGKINSNCKLGDILELPHFGEFFGTPGIFLYVGKDFLGNMIYTLGTSCEGPLIKKSAIDLLKILGHDPDKIKLYDVTMFVPKHLTWSNAILARPSKKLIAQSLFKRLTLIEREIKNQQDL
ncbi:MAG: DUF3189 family protein [Peptococcales bacterium]|jgi:hypothetical protein